MATLARLTLIGLGALALGACAAATREGAKPRIASEPVVTMVEEPEWRSIARSTDTWRIDVLDRLWADALSGVRPGRDARAVAAEGALLEPDAAQPFPAPPPGHYNCRVVRLATNGRVKGFKPWSCHIGNDDKLLSFTKQGGSDRPAGWMWADGDTRLVFLGAMVEGEDVPAYGDAGRRSLIGAVERVADFRWRVVLPPQGGEWSLDVIELIPMVPATPG